MPDLPETLCLIATAREEYNTRITDYNMIKAAYNKVVPGWEEKQNKSCIIIRSKYGYNNYQKIKALDWVYKILDILRSGRSTSTRKLIELTTKFYVFILADYKNITDFSS
jgi:hypothetical protein